MSIPTPVSGNLGNFLSNFSSEVQIMFIGVILVFLVISVWYLIRKKMRKFK